MTMNEIISRHEKLSRDLSIALSTMERKSTIAEIREELIHLQDRCPHFSNEHNFEMVDGYCPYCGKKLMEGWRND